MPQKKNAEAPGLSLFPFLSILACLSGTLITIISALSAMQSQNVKNQMATSNPLAVEFMEMQNENSELLELVSKSMQTKRYQKQLLVLQEQNVAVLDILQGRKEAKVVNAALQRAVENLVAQIEEIKLDQEVEEKKIVDLKKEIAERKINPENLRPINVKPTGSGVVGSRRLYVLEASGGTLIAHRHDEPELRISQGSIGLDTKYNEYLRGAAMNRNYGSDGLMLFLVRPDGYGAYQRGAGWAEEKFLLKTVKVPIPAKGVLDLTEFKPYMVPIQERFGPKGKAKTKTAAKKPVPKKPAPKKPAPKKK
jgi:hypothetical protein